MTVNWSDIARTVRKAPLPAKAAAAAVAGVLALSGVIGAALALSPTPETPVPPSSPTSVAEDVATAAVGLDEAEAVQLEEQAEPSYLPDASVPDPLAVAAEARSALNGASSTNELNLFDASDGTSRALGSDEAADVEAAIAAFADAGCSVGFVVYDLASQRGLGYNADGLYFCASASRPPASKRGALRPM